MRIFTYYIIEMARNGNGLWVVSRVDECVRIVFPSLWRQGEILLEGEIQKNEFSLVCVLVPLGYVELLPYEYTVPF